MFFVNVGRDAPARRCYRHRARTVTKGIFAYRIGAFDAFGAFGAFGVYRIIAETDDNIIIMASRLYGFAPAAFRL